MFAIGAAGAQGRGANADVVPVTPRPPTKISVAASTTAPVDVPSPVPVRTVAFERTPSDPSFVLLAVAIALVPVAVATTVWASAGGDGDFNRRVTLQAFDVALVMAGLARISALVAAPGRQRRTKDARIAALRRGSRDPLSCSLGVLAALGVVALAVHPSPRGVELAARLVLGGFAVHAFVAAPALWRSRLQAMVAVTASLQAILAIAQSANGAPLGLTWLEFDGSLYQFGTSTAGNGGLLHPYHLALLLEVGIAAAICALRHARRRLPWLVAIATCSAGLGVTYSRAAAIGVAAAVIALLWPRRDRRHDVVRRGYAFAAAAMLVGAAATGVVMGNGWYTRTSGSANVASVDSGRVERAREAIELIRSEPLVGVGPGQYSIARAARGDEGPLPPHNFVLHIAAEGGLLAGLAASAVGILLARRYLVAARETAASFVLVVPYFLLDGNPYVCPVGLLLSALWFGLLERATRR